MTATSLPLYFPLVSSLYSKKKGLVILKSRSLQIFLIIFSAEVIYTIPFHLPRFFRYEFLKCFGILNEELAVAQSWYGITAILSYFPGGLIAELFNPALLMGLSLLMTAAAGLLLFFFHDPFSLKLIYALWGILTILLFWSAMISLMRQTSSEDNQGKAFGSLEFGRGAITALIVTLLHFLASSGLVTTSDSPEIFYGILSFYIIITASSGIFCLSFLKNSFRPQTKKTQGESISWEKIFSIFKNPSAWLNAFIIVVAYCAFKGIDFYSLFAKEQFSLKAHEMALFVMLIAWVRPFSAILFGQLGDRFKSSVSCFLCFALAAAGSFPLYWIPFETMSYTTFLIFITLQVTGIYGIRGVYFTLFNESKIGREKTGLASGFLSFIGFTPEFFLPLIAVGFIEQNPKPYGFQQFLLFIGVLCLFGLVSALALKRNGMKQEAIS